MKGSPRKRPRPHRVNPSDKRYSHSVRATGYPRGSGVATKVARIQREGLPENYQYKAVYQDATGKFSFLFVPEGDPHESAIRKLREYDSQGKIKDYLGSVTSLELIHQKKIPSASDLVYWDGGHDQWNPAYMKDDQIGKFILVNQPFTKAGTKRKIPKIEVKQIIGYDRDIRLTWTSPVFASYQDRAKAEAHATKLNQDPSSRYTLHYWMGHSRTAVPARVKGHAQSVIAKQKAGNLS